MTDLRFGLFISQANRSWAEVLDAFLLAEELGFDHAWLVDHLVDTDGPPSNPIHEAWTLLAAIAAHTERIRLGILVTSNTFRHPSLLMKEAVTVDHISAGRLILGLGTGWHADEHRRWGIPLPPAAERVDRLEETVQIAHRLMTEESVTCHGRYYQLEDAHLAPKPIQEPHIPILVAAHRPRMLRLAARYADQWDTFAPLHGAATDGMTDSVGDRLAALDAECREIGRDPAEIRRSTWATRDVFASEERYARFVREHVALGFTDVSGAYPDAENVPMLRRIGREVVPGLRREAQASRET